MRKNNASKNARKTRTATNGRTELRQYIKPKGSGLTTPDSR